MTLKFKTETFSYVVLFLALVFCNEGKSTKESSKSINFASVHPEYTLKNISDSTQLPKLYTGNLVNNITGNATFNEEQKRIIRETRKRRNSKSKPIIIHIDKLGPDQNQFKTRYTNDLSKAKIQQTSRIEQNAENSIYPRKREVDQYEDFNNNLPDSDDNGKNTDDAVNEEIYKKVKIKHHHHHHHHNHIKEIIKKVPEPYPVEKIIRVPVEKVVEKIVHVPKIVEKIVNVPYEKIIHVPKPYAVEKIIEKKVPYPIEKIVHVPIEKIVEKIIHVPKPYPVEKVVEKIVHIPVEKVVEKIVHVPKPYPVEKIVNKLIHVPRPYPVIKPVPYPVEVKVPMQHESHISYNTEKNTDTAHQSQNYRRLQPQRQNSLSYSYENIGNEYNDKVIQEQQEQKNNLKENHNIESSTNIGYERNPLQTINYGANPHKEQFNIHQNYNAFGFYKNTEKNDDENQDELVRGPAGFLPNNVINSDMQQQGSTNSFHVYAIDSSLPISLPIFQIPPHPFQQNFDYSLGSSS